MNFGLILQPGWRPLDPPDILTYNRRAIGLLTEQFTTLWAEDHFQKGAAPALESWTTLTFMASEFPRFQVGTIVLSQSYRNPAMLAKMSATLQYLTGGRLILGIGAGWQEDEYHAYDYEFPRSGVRVAQLQEAVELIRTMWTDSPATYHGTYYRVENAYCEPRPDPPPPIMIGAFGDRNLKVAARLADGWNAGMSIERYRERLALLRRYCHEFNRNPDEMTLSFYAHAFFTENADEFEERAAFLHQADVTLLGPTARAAVEQLQPYADLGVSHVAVKPYTLNTVEELARAVAPRFP